jgi:hypothetical protein
MKIIAITAQRISEKVIRKMSLFIFSLTLLYLILLNPLGLSAQKCSFSLIAKNNIESVNNEGRIYFMEIQNNKIEELDLNLSVTNSNSGENPDMTASGNNVNLNAELLYEDGQKIKGKVILKSNELLRFQVKVTVPAGTTYNRWNNLVINASSDNCDASSSSSSLTLYTFIPDPEER